jgi:hypothetical protein
MSPRLTAAALVLRLVAAFALLAAGGVLILDAVVITASSSALKGTLVGVLGFAILSASIWVFIRTYERLVH